MVESLNDHELVESLKEMGLSEDEIEARRKEYITSLKRSVINQRKILNEHLRRTLGRCDQNFLRRASWRHMELLGVDAAYSDACYQLRTHLPLKKNIGSSPQDIYHTQHLVNCFLLSVLNPDEQISEDQVKIAVHTEYEVCESEEERLENTLMLYQHLQDLIPREGKPQTRQVYTLNDVMSKLNAIESKLEDLTKS